MWTNGVVVTLTEFGRTVKANGSDGTDHGLHGLTQPVGRWLVGGWQGGIGLAGASQPKFV